ncbi:MAG: hypothetical protein GYA33_09615, partial [Thermogutta sp.]|nr:hypothetical protein [Thermogutta sp.]
WAKRVMPAVLRKLARHASIQTTLGYYVDLDAEALADELWAEYVPRANETGNTFGNIDPRTGAPTRDADAT